MSMKLDIVKLVMGCRLVGIREGLWNTLERANSRACVRVIIYHQIFVKTKNLTKFVAETGLLENIWTTTILNSN